MSEVAALEDVCERAWPPRERVELDGAVLRFTDGFTRRANSARVDGGGDDLDGLIARAEHEYRSRGLRPGLPADAALAAGVRAPAARARLRRRHRGGRDGRRGAARGRSGTRPATTIELEPGLGEEWLRVFQAIERHWPRRAGPRARAGCSARATSPRRFALARVDGAPAATGYARLEDDWLYIACVGDLPRPPPARARARRQRAALRLGRRQRRAARHLAGRRRKTPPRRGFTRSSASARATSIATSCRAPRSH